MGHRRTRTAESAPCCSMPAPSNSPPPPPPPPPLHNGFVLGKRFEDEKWRQNSPVRVVVETLMSTKHAGLTQFQKLQHTAHGWNPCSSISVSRSWAGKPTVKFRPICRKCYAHPALATRSSQPRSHTLPLFSSGHRMCRKDQKYW